MRCSRARSLLSPYLDGELSENNAQQVRDHLQRCANCREAWQQIEQLDTLSKTTLPDEASDAYWANFLPRLHRKIETTPSQNLWTTIRESLKAVLFPSSPLYRTAGAVASVVLVFIVGWAVLRDPGTRNMVVVPAEHSRAKKIEEETPVKEIGQASEKSDVAEKGKEEDLSPTLMDGERLTVQSTEDQNITLQPLEAEPVAKRGGRSPVEFKQTTEGKQGIQTTMSPVDNYASVSSDETRWMYEQARQQQMTGENETAASQYRYLLDNHPQSREADDAQFQLNVIKSSPEKEEQLSLEKWQAQRDAWHHFQQTYPESDLSDQVCLKLAESWYQIASVTLNEEDIRQALVVNRQCQQAWQDEKELNNQSIELQRMLTRNKK